MWKSHDAAEITGLTHADKSDRYSFARYAARAPRAKKASALGRDKLRSLRQDHLPFASRIFIERLFCCFIISVSSSPLAFQIPRCKTSAAASCTLPSRGSGHADSASPQHWGRRGERRGTAFR